MLKPKYFLKDIFILSAEKQPINSSWRKIEWLLTHVRFSPKNADNGICAGNEYELHYWNNGWHSCGTVRAKYEYVEFENVPQGCLYWLENRTQGGEEMPFVLDEKGEQRFIYYNLIKIKQ